jgi:pimeloyl-ACP methyl ester carboxylesterase
MIDRQKRVALPGGTFAYLEDGPKHGPLALLLHGFPDVPHTFASLTRALVGAGYRVVRPYLRGYHPSTLEGPFDLDRLGADVVELAEALSPDRPCAVVGHDWGALSVYQALPLAPARFTRAVCLALPHPMAIATNAAQSPDQLRKLGYVFFFQVPILPERALRRDGFAALTTIYRRSGVTLGEDHRTALIGSFARSLPGPLGPYRAVFWPPQRTVARVAASRRPSRKIRVPTMTLLGGKDVALNVTTASGQERYFAGPFRSEVLPEAGHWLHLDHADEVNRAVLGWLAG